MSSSPEKRRSGSTKKSASRLRREHTNTLKNRWKVSKSANIQEAEKVYLAKQMKILANGTLTYSRKQSALRALGNARNTYFHVPYTGPMIDVVGFRQHTDECSSDALVQVFTNGVPWYAIVQRLLYTMTVQQFRKAYNALVRCPGPHPDQGPLEQLVFYIQERFKNHYAVLKHIEEGVRCGKPYDFSLISPIINRKIRLSAELAPMVKRGFRDISKTSLHATSPIHICHILKTLFHLFGILDIECYVRNTSYISKATPGLFIESDIQYKHYTQLAFLIYANPFLVSEVSLYEHTHFRSGHVSAIYKMQNEKWVYYDNEGGIMDLHPILMEDILNETKPEYLVGYTSTKRAESGGITFYKIPYFNLNGLADLKEKTIHKWTKDHWAPIPITEISTTTMIFVVTNIVHIASDDTEEEGFKGDFMDDAV